MTVFPLALNLNLILHFAPFTSDVPTFELDTIKMPTARMVIIAIKTPKLPCVSFPKKTHSLIYLISSSLILKVSTNTLASSNDSNVPLKYLYC